MQDVVFYCRNCWTRVKEDEKVCHQCEANIETLDYRSYFEKLVSALHHPERTTRIRAAYNLGELRDRRAIKPFAEVISKASDVFFLEMVAVALGKVGGAEALAILIRLMDHPSFLVRRATLYSLDKFRSKEALRVIKNALKDAGSDVQELAKKILQSPTKNIGS